MALTQFRPAPAPAPVHSFLELDFGYFFDRKQAIRAQTEAALIGLLAGGLTGERGEFSLGLCGDMIRCEGETPREVRAHVLGLPEGDLIANLKEAHDGVQRIVVPKKFYLADDRLALDVRFRDQVESLMVGCRYACLSGVPHRGRDKFFNAYKMLADELSGLDDQWCLAVFEDEPMCSLDDLLGPRKWLNREWI